MEIRHIDLLVHPDFTASTGAADDQNIVALRAGWDERISELAKTEDSLLLYFTAFSLNDKKVGSGPIKLPTAIELGRRQRYQDLLGSKMFLFDTLFMPTRFELLKIFDQRNFKLQEKGTSLTAYGEYFDVCVRFWLEHIQNALRLPNLACTRDPKLSSDRRFIDELVKYLRKPPPNHLFPDSRVLRTYSPIAELINSI